jgi:hypothetical protein
MPLRRYWFEFDFAVGTTIPPGTRIGCGVTAFDRADAEQLLRERVFGTTPLPAVQRVIEDVDISGLDKGHVLPNMGAPINRGVWFPVGYQ